MVSDSDSVLIHQRYAVVIQHFIPAAAAAAAVASAAEESAGWLTAVRSRRSAASAATAASCAAAAVHAAAELVPVTPTPTRNCPRKPELTASAVGRCCAPLYKQATRQRL